MSEEENFEDLAFAKELAGKAPQQLTVEDMKKAKKLIEMRLKKQQEKLQKWHRTRKPKAPFNRD